MSAACVLTARGGHTFKGAHAQYEEVIQLLTLMRCSLGLMGRALCRRLAAEIRHCRASIHTQLALKLTRFELQVVTAALALQEVVKPLAAYRTHQNTHAHTHTSMHNLLQVVTAALTLQEVVKSRERGVYEAPPGALGAGERDACRGLTNH